MRHSTLQIKQNVGEPQNLINQLQIP